MAIIVPAINNTIDALGNSLTSPGEVRQLAKVTNVNVGNFADTGYQIQFSSFVGGFTFTNSGTAIGVEIDGTGLLTVTGAGLLYDLQIFDGATLVAHYSFNEGEEDIVYDLVGSNNGTWVGHTEPNQWGKSDDAIDYRLVNKEFKFINYFSASDLGANLEEWRAFDNLAVSYIPGTGVVWDGTSATTSSTPSLLLDNNQINYYIGLNRLVAKNYTCDIKYDFTAPTGIGNFDYVRIIIESGSTTIVGVDFNPLEGVDLVGQLTINVLTTLPDINSYDPINIKIIMNHSQTSDGIFILKSAESDIYFTDISKNKGFINTGSNIDFNPYLALGENVDRDYEYKGLVNADANMYLNQTSRLPSLTDFLIYNKSFVNADQIRRTYAYISEGVGRLNSLTDVEAVATDKLVKELKGVE